MINKDHFMLQEPYEFQALPSCGVKEKLFQSVHLPGLCESKAKTSQTSLKPIDKTDPPFEEFLSRVRNSGFPQRGRFGHTSPFIRIWDILPNSAQHRGFLRGRRCFVLFGDALILAVLYFKFLIARQGFMCLMN